MKKKSSSANDARVFVTTRDNATTRAVRVDLDATGLSDLLSSIASNNDVTTTTTTSKNVAVNNINLRLTRTGKKFPIRFQNANNNNSNNARSRGEQSLRQLGVRNNDHFVFHVSLLGGGGDGGATGA